MTRSIWLLGLVALPLAAQADNFGYTFIEGGFVNTDLDGAAGDADGFGFGGAFSVADNFHVLASYTDQDYDFGDGRSYSVGAGFNTGLSQDLDLVAHLSYVDAEVDVNTGPFSFTANDDGYSLGAGIRARTSSKIELEAGLDYVDLDLAGSDTALRVGGRYYFNNAFAAGLSLADNDDGTSWMLSLRAEFGSR